MENRTESLENAQNSISLWRITKLLIVLIALLIIGSAVFFAVKIRIDAKTMLREAKNVYLALNTTDIEYYAEGRCVYDPARPYGLAEGVTYKVKALVDNEGAYRILTYDKETRQITGFTYWNEGYQVNYSYYDNNSVWEVSYSFRLYKMDGKGR